jgi:hypothetical protein
MAATRVNVGASESKGATDAKKAMAPIQKCHVPTSHMLAAASSVKFHESPPHSQAPQNSVPETVSRLEPEVVPRSGPEASLQMTHPAASVGIQFWTLSPLSLQVRKWLFVCLLLSQNEMLTFVVCPIRWS